MSDRPTLADRLKRWLADVESPLDEYWQEPPRAAEWLNLGLLSDLGPPGGMRVRSYWLKNRAVLLHRKQTNDRGRQELCLLALDEPLRRKIRQAIDDRGTCWVGDLDEIVLHPRVAFPTDRHFTTVAVAETHVCALDDAGAAVCCGARFHDDPPEVLLSAIAVGEDFDCGVTAEGAMRCWGHRPPADGDPFPGPFSQLSVSKREVCAIRSDTRAQQCWSRDRPRMANVLPERAASVVSAFWQCALLEDGRISCGIGPAGRVLNGPFTAIASGDGGAICGVTAPPDPGVRCWDLLGWPASARGPATTLSQPVTLEEPISVAVAPRDGGCALSRSGRVACWPPDRNHWDGLYRAIAGGPDRLCAITVEGRVQCDGTWPKGPAPVPPDQ
jgi:hypothetical protein